MTERTYTRRNYLTIRVLLDREEPVTFVDMFAAIEAVASTAIEHPEWDMDELRTWAEWEGDK